MVRGKKQINIDDLEFKNIRKTRSSILNRQIDKWNILFIMLLYKFGIIILIFSIQILSFNQ